MLAHTFVPIAEAAFIADLSDRDMNRVVDEHILPGILVDVDQGRRVAPLGAAFARFYFRTDRQLAAEFRRKVLGELATRLERRPDWLSLSSMTRLPDNLSWGVEESGISIDLRSFVDFVYRRVHDVEQANALVREDPQIMDGAPVFAGTRVPIDIVLASLDQGIDSKRLAASYPFLTEAHVEAARTYASVHRRVGRPRRLAQAYPQLKPKSRRLLRPAA
jgi:uncharacterized protein (DUF433 family)